METNKEKDEAYARERLKDSPLAALDLEKKAAAAAERQKVKVTLPTPPLQELPIEPETAPNIMVDNKVYSID